MSQLRSLLLVSVALLFATGCSPKCGPSNCDGCCDGNGACHVFSNEACGKSGASCQTCVGLEQCVLGTCQLGGSGNGNGSGSGSPSSSASTSASGSSSGTSSGTTTGGTTASVGATSGSASSSGATTGGNASSSSTTATSTTSATTSTTSTNTTSTSTSTSTTGTSGTTSSSSSSSSGTTSTSSSSSNSSSSGGTTGSTCTAGQTRCSAPTGSLGSGREQCDSSGAWVAISSCATTELCSDTGGTATCQSPCAAADASSTTFACDFWGAITPNTLDPAFTGNSVGYSPGTTPSEFAFVAVNPFNQDAHLTIKQAGLADQRATAPAGGTAVVRVPWRAICGTGEAQFGYHVTSDQPVGLYQFNPVAAFVDAGAGATACTSDFDCIVTGNTCINGFCGGGVINAYTNDASLLLPTHLLGTGYVAVASSQVAEGSFPLPGEFTIVATQDNTNVQLTFAGDTEGTRAPDGGCGTTQGSFTSNAQGSQSTFTLMAGQVLQFYGANTGTPTCVQNPRPATVCLYPNDLTGTVVSASAPVAVFGGAECAYVPFNQVACDHLEEQLLPYRAWGRTHVGTKSHNYAGSTSSAPDLWRLVSACGPSSCPSGTTVTITPSVASFRAGPNHASSVSCTTSGNATTCTLPPLTTGGAPWVEFQHASSFVAASDQPVSLAQYFVSESAQGSPTEGDPSLVVTPPVEQWRTEFQVLAPTTFLHNYANVAVRGQAATTNVTIDGATILAADWANVPGTDYYVAVESLCGSADPRCAGIHAISGGSNPVGVVVYGYDSYVSYGYTGGVNVLSLNSGAPGQ